MFAIVFCSKKENISAYTYREEGPVVLWSSCSSSSSPRRFRPSPMASPTRKSHKFGPSWCLQPPLSRSSSRRCRTRSSCRCKATPTCLAVSTALGTCWTHVKITSNYFKQFAVASLIVSAYFYSIVTFGNFSTVLLPKIARLRQKWISFKQIRLKIAEIFRTRSLKLLLLKFKYGKIRPSLLLKLLINRLRMFLRFLGNLRFQKSTECVEYAKIRVIFKLDHSVWCLVDETNFYLDSISFIAFIKI